MALDQDSLIAKQNSQAFTRGSVSSGWKGLSSPGSGGTISSAVRETGTKPPAVLRPKGRQPGLSMNTDRSSEMHRKRWTDIWISCSAFRRRPCGQSPHCIYLLCCLAATHAQIHHLHHPLPSLRKEQLLLKEETTQMKPAEEITLTCI